MKNCSPNRNNISITNYYTPDNCDCQCHFPEDCEITQQNQILCQNIHTIHAVSPCHSHSPSPDRIRVSAQQKKSMKNLQTNMSAACLCVCDTICNCPCHCVSCL